MTFHFLSFKRDWNRIALSSMIRESVQYVGQLSLAGSQWKVDQADQASRLQNMDNLEIKIGIGVFTSLSF